MLRGTAVSSEDWIIGVGLAPPLLLGIWIQTYRVWRHRADVSAGISWATGSESVAGYHAFLLPAVTAMTMTWSGVMLFEVADPAAGGVLDTALKCLLGAGIFLMFFSYWMWAFMRPRFLVPRHLRGQRGWVAATLHAWRNDRASRRERRQQVGSRSGGDHAQR
jgi:hypothetical protein